LTRSRRKINGKMPTESFNDGAGNILQSGHAARTVRRVDGLCQTQHVNADTEEQLSGYWVIDVPDINQATEWASLAPAAVAGSVEVRAVE
jgi:hypothetical protein